MLKQCRKIWRWSCLLLLKLLHLPEPIRLCTDIRNLSIISTFWYQEMWMKMTFVFTGLPQHYVWDCLLHYQLFLQKSLFLTRHIKEIQWKQCDSRIVAFKNHSIQKCNFNHLYMNSVNKVKTVALMRTVSNTRHTLQPSTVVLILHEIKPNKVQAPRLFTGELFTREISRSVASILS